jgi:pyruvate/2-oxoglutarate/acetoin dehydrogenase E1 component
MEEEMIRDETVFVIGEEVARYNGAYKVSYASSSFCTMNIFSPLERTVNIVCIRGRANGQITKGLLDKFGEDRVIDVSPSPGSGTVEGQT